MAPRGLLWALTVGTWAMLSEASPGISGSNASTLAAHPSSGSGLLRPGTARLRVPAASSRGLPPLNSTRDGVCRHLLDHGLTVFMARSPSLLGTFSHENLARGVEASPSDLAHLHVPRVSPCSGHEVWARTLLIYRHCTNRQKTVPRACAFLDVPRFTESLMLSSTLEEREAQRACAQLGLRPCKFYSQMGEDAAVFNMFFKNQRGGTYLEMGALDGVQYSNTLFYEQTMSWKGVLIEPGAKFGLLARNRGAGSKTGSRNTLHNLAVCNTPGNVTFQYLTGREAEGGLDHPVRMHDKNAQILTRTVKCDTLGNILKASGVARVDLFSLDVEGRELEVLQSMDWNVTFNVLVMERTKDHAEIEALLLSKGYQYVREQRGNAIWALSTFRPAVGGGADAAARPGPDLQAMGDIGQASVWSLSTLVTGLTLAIVGFLTIVRVSRRAPPPHARQRGRSRVRGLAQAPVFSDDGRGRGREI